MSLGPPPAGTAAGAGPPPPPRPLSCQWWGSAPHHPTGPGGMDPDGVGLLDLRFLPLIQAVSYGHVYPVTSCHSPYGDW